MIMETVFHKQLNELEQYAIVDRTVTGGEKITIPIRAAVSSNAAAYTRSDVDPASGTMTVVDATFNKDYYHTSWEVSGLDLAQAQAGGQPAISNLIADAALMEMNQLEAVIYDAIMTDWKLHIDASTAYSDASLSRSTYATLASTEENTNTALTPTIMRTHSHTVRLNKLCGPKSGYQFLMESAVLYAVEPKISALHGWDVPSTLGAKDLGYQPMRSFEGQAVVSPQGMTTGDVLYGRKQDFQVRYHMPLSIEQVPSGRHSAKFVARIGINGLVINPGYCGKMTDKD